MGLHNADYRVSAIVVLCKDCGEDVGLYPARHKCTNNYRPQLPTLCSSTSDSSWNSSEDERSMSRQASENSIETNSKWGGFFKSSTVDNSIAVKDQSVKVVEEDESIYYDKFAANLNDSNSPGKKLWGRVKENEKWKELITNKDKKEEKKSGKLWERLIQATIPALEHDAHEAESDQDDWEGETHVSRILREHYQTKKGPLPTWLLDHDSDIRSYNSNVNNNTTHNMHNSNRLNSNYSEQIEKTVQRSSTRTRRLWQTAENDQETTRERERRALRENKLIHQEKISLLSRSQSERGYPFDNNHNNSIRFDNQNEIYGSIAPRRTNTTRSNVSRIRPFQ